MRKNPESPALSERYPIPRVVFQPAVGQGFKRGIDWLVKAIQPTLGPLPRYVVMPRATRGAPEILDHGASIARRVLQLPDREADAGAMFIRHVLWQQHEREGDGTATTAVLLQEIFNGGLTFVAAGGNAMQLRRQLEAGARLILQELDRQTLPVEGQEMLERVALAVCGDEALAHRLGEIFDIIGEHGWFEVRTGRGRDLEREYVEGIYWEGGALSWRMLADQPNARAELEDPAIFISDLEFDEPEQLVPVLSAAAATGYNTLVIIAARVADRALGLLLANRQAGTLVTLAVKPPGATANDVHAALDDLAQLSGGRPYVRLARPDLAQFQAADFGRARRCWANKDHFGMVGGRGDPRALRAHIAALRAAFSHASDADQRKAIRARIGKLMGGSAVLWLAGATDSALRMRQETAERTAEAVRGALMQGVLPGGGAALLACRKPLLERLSGTSDTEERAALRILLAAVERPFRVLVGNAGYEPAAVMAAVDAGGPGAGFDITRGLVVDTVTSGVLDSASVQKGAVWRAVTGAALALTTDVLVQHKNPQGELTP